MKTIGALLIVIAALVLGVLIQDRADASDEETQLILLERAWNQAETGGDPSAIARLFEDTLVYVDYDGSLLNKAEYLRSVANPVSKPDHIRDEGMKVHVYGTTGIVSGIYRETGKEKGKPYTRRARFTDTWIKQSGQWRCVASQSTLIH
jgi:ketosteroid isomerase-like protein